MVDLFIPMCPFEAEINNVKVNIHLFKVYIKIRCNIIISSEVATTKPLRTTFCITNTNLSSINR